MNNPDPSYSAYLLRLWQVGGSGELAWRASLEDAQTRELIGFRSLDHLCCYLRERSALSTNALSTNPKEATDQKEDSDSI